MKRKIIFFSIFLFSLILNIIPLCVFDYQVTITDFSRFPIIVMVLVSVNGILSYIFRHRGNFLTIKNRGFNAWRAPQKKLPQKHYEKFFWQFIVYWSAIPFYLPCIHFGLVSKGYHILWTLLILGIPQTVFFIYDTIQLIKIMKSKEIK